MIIGQTRESKNETESSCQRKKELIRFHVIKFNHCVLSENYPLVWNFFSDLTAHGSLRSLDTEINHGNFFGKR